MRPALTGMYACFVTAAVALGGCGQPAATGSAATPVTPAPGGTSVSTAAPTTVPPTTVLPTTVVPSTAPSGYSKVLIIAEENHSYDEITNAPDAAYLNGLTATYGSATNMNAGYPAGCPSLAAYILLTSGSTQGICDDKDPKAHPLSGPSIFSQVADAGGEWRDYAESAPTNCATTNSADGRFLVRHVPAVYYLTEVQRCPRWDIPLGTVTAGPLHDDLAAGTLPGYGFVSPDACDDMHGARACPTQGTANGDAWLRTWMPIILAGPDYTGGRLVIIITWDEGTGSDNHIPTLVISPTTRRVSSATAYTHCSTLRTVEEILRLPLLGCATTAASMTADFHVAPGSP